LKAVNAVLKIQLLSFDGQVLYQQNLPVELAANTAKVYTQITTKNIAEFDPTRSVLYCQLMNGSETLAEHRYYFEKDKNLELPLPKISLKQLTNDSFLLKTDQLAKGICLSWDDRVADQNYFDLLPGEGKIVRFKPVQNGPSPAGLPQIKTLNEVLNRLKN